MFCCYQCMLCFHTIHSVDIQTTQNLNTQTDVKWALFHSNESIVLYLPVKRIVTDALWYHLTLMVVRRSRFICPKVRNVNTHPTFIVEI